MGNLKFIKGKTAVVTGATGGIGLAIADRLAALGMNLVLTGRKVEKLALIVSEIQKKHEVQVSMLAGDLAADKFPDNLVKFAFDTFGGIDVLINGAGIAQSCTFKDVTPELFDRVMAINVKAPYFLTQAALPFLRKSNCGTVINICSVVAHKGYPMQSVYVASKHALLGWTKALAAEEYLNGVRVHAISPGGVYTDMVQLTRPDLSSEGMILPEDIADIIEFYLEHRTSNAVIDEVRIHRLNKMPFA